MAETCFVIMPFGGKFDEIYAKIYVPAIRGVGLEPLRADEIYNNQAIFQDIDRCIRDAAVILADVTGRNPNVNYELGAAHALKKEVVIVTGDSKDVPSDYRHIRYLSYNIGDFNWNQTLEEGIKRTLAAVLERRRREESVPAMDGVEFDEEEDLMWVISRAKKLGYDYQNDPHSPSHALLRCRGSFVMLDSREGPVNEWEAAVAALLCEKVQQFSNKLYNGQLLRMRSVFFDLYAFHGFRVDYLYDRKRDELPLYTPREICRALDDEFDGQIFNASVRYLEEDFDHDRFAWDADQYYRYNTLPQERHPVCRRDGYYVADLDRCFSAAGHTFYCLDGLLPLSELEADSYVSGESHWLADWDQPEPRFKEGDTVKFKVKRVYEPAVRSHVSHARNISFTVLEPA